VEEHLEVEVEGGLENGDQLGVGAAALEPQGEDLIYLQHPLQLKEYNLGLKVFLMRLSEGVGTSPS